MSSGFFKSDHFLLVFHSQQASQELTEVLNELWRLDTNRLKPGTDYTISLQVSTADVLMQELKALSCSKFKCVWSESHFYLWKHNTIPAAANFYVHTGATCMFEEEFQ